MKLSLIIVLIGASLVAADAGEELLIAARRGQVAEVKKLLESGAPLETKNQYGATPLYLAVFNGHTAAALLLLEKGANPNVTDTFYKASVLDSALQKEKPEIIRALIARGVPVSGRQLNMSVGADDPATIEAILTAPWKPEDLTGALKAALAAKNDKAAAIFRKAGAAEPKNVNVSPETLASYAGEYLSAALPLGIRISAADGQLKLQADGQQQITLSTDSPTEFSFAMAGLRMVFDGKDGFVLHQGGQQFPYAKKGSAAAPVVKKVPDGLLAAYAGVYIAEAPPIEITISGQEGQLGLQVTGQPRIPLRTESDTEFTFAPAGVRVVFSSKSSFTLFQGGKEIILKKKENAK